MGHDFETGILYGQMQSHMASGCNNQGQMSYKTSTWPPWKWSSCSAQDFNDYYWNIVDKTGKWCLQEAPKACP